MLNSSQSVEKLRARTLSFSCFLFLAHSSTLLALNVISANYSLIVFSVQSSPSNSRFKYSTGPPLSPVWPRHFSHLTWLQFSLLNNIFPIHRPKCLISSSLMTKVYHQQALLILPSKYILSSLLHPGQVLTWIVTVVTWPMSSFCPFLPPVRSQYDQSSPFRLKSNNIIDLLSSLQEFPFPRKISKCLQDPIQSDSHSFQPQASTVIPWPHFPLYSSWDAQS